MIETASKNILDWRGCPNALIAEAYYHPSGCFNSCARHNCRRGHRQHDCMHFTKVNGLVIGDISNSSVVAMNSKNGILVVSQREITGSVLVIVAEFVQYQQRVCLRWIMPRLKLFNDLLGVERHSLQIIFKVSIPIVLIFSKRERSSTCAVRLDSLCKATN